MSRETVFIEITEQQARKASAIISNSFYVEYGLSEGGMAKLRDWIALTAKNPRYHNASAYADECSGSGFASMSSLVTKSGMAEVFLPTESDYLWNLVLQGDEISEGLGD